MNKIIYRITKELDSIGVNSNNIQFISTSNSFNINSLLSGEVIVNLERVNNIRRINKFHKSINPKLDDNLAPSKGVFIRNFLKFLPLLS